jgi:hypothetical protein
MRHNGNLSTKVRGLHGIPLGPAPVLRRGHHHDPVRVTDLPRRPLRPVLPLLSRGKIQPRIDAVRPQEQPQTPHPLHVRRIIVSIRNQHPQRRSTALARTVSRPTSSAAHLAPPPPRWPPLPPRKRIASTGQASDMALRLSTRKPSVSHRPGFSAAQPAEHGRHSLPAQSGTSRRRTPSPRCRRA